MSSEPAMSPALLDDVRQLIVDARQRVAVVVNTELTMLYWQIGRRINAEILHGQRAQYGKQIVASLARQLTEEYGKGWGEKHLRHCLRLAETFPNEPILYTLCREFTWSHLRLLMFIEDPLKRDFYIELGRVERWSVRQMQERINSLLFERTAISRKPEETIQGDLARLRQEGQMSPEMAFRDPYVLDFWGCRTAILKKTWRRQSSTSCNASLSSWGQTLPFWHGKSVSSSTTAIIGLISFFFHRRLKCLVAIDLKIGEFEAAHKGQMELYLRYLEKYEQMEGESAPIGLILCTGKNEEHVELMRLDQSNIRVADYLTALPPRETFQAKLHQSIAIARQRMLGKEEE